MLRIILLCLSLLNLDDDLRIEVSYDNLFYSVVIDYNDDMDDLIKWEEFHEELYEIEVEGSI